MTRIELERALKFITDDISLLCKKVTISCKKCKLEYAHLQQKGETLSRDTCPVCGKPMDIKVDEGFVTYSEHKHKYLH